MICHLFPEAWRSEREKTLLAVLLLLDAPECGKPSWSMVEITVASCWFWKSWCLSGKWIGVCTVSMQLKKLESLGSGPVFGVWSDIRPLQRADALGPFMQLLALDAEDAEDLDGGEVGEDKTRGN